MSDSVYKIIELVGSSDVSWDDAAKVAIEKASKSLKDLRIAEVIQQDIKMENGNIAAYRIKMKVSFKYLD